MSMHASKTSHKYDFSGAVEKLDYLKSLGINAVEVMPIHKNAHSKEHSPQRFDWGYDPIDLDTLDLVYGTAGDFQDFGDQCHKRGIGVIFQGQEMLETHPQTRRHWTVVSGCDRPAAQDGLEFQGTVSLGPYSVLILSQ